MNTIRENIEKYVPIIIQYGSNTYVGFVTEKESNSDVIMPVVYRKFMNKSKSLFPFKDTEKAVSGDYVYKMSLDLYFKAACELKKYRKTYNLNKIKHELNNRK